MVGHWPIFSFFAFLWHVEVQGQRSQKSTIFSHLHQTSLRVNKGFIIRPKQNLFLQDKAGNPEHFAFSGSQLERSIRFTWPFNKKFFFYKHVVLSRVPEKQKEKYVLEPRDPSKSWRKTGEN